MVAFWLVGNGSVQFHRQKSFMVYRGDDSPREFDWGWLWEPVHGHRRNPCSSEGDFAVLARWSSGWDFGEFQGTQLGGWGLWLGWHMTGDDGSP